MVSAETDWWAGLVEPDTRIPDAVDRLAGIVADLHIAIGSLATEQRAIRDHFAAVEAMREAISAEVYPLAVPPRSAQVTSGGALTIADPQQLGPATGIVWDIRRVSVFGLASSSETVSLWKVSSAAAVSAAPQNFVCTLTGPSAFQPFGLGTVTLRAHESLMITGTSLTASEWVTLSADGISVSEPWAGL